jgi:RNA polymerase sigma-70 factor (ECF subfamily)
VQPRGAFTSITSRMDDEVQQLLRKRRYDEALEQLLDLYEEKIFRMALAMLRDAGRAEDITQDVFLKAWRALPAYDWRAAIGTWLYAIARNTCLSALRSESYRRTWPMTESIEPAVAGTTAIDIEVAECLAALPDVQRQVITLYYLQEKSVRDVSELQNLPEGTVKSHLHRARRALAGMLG